MYTFVSIPSAQCTRQPANSPGRHGSHRSPWLLVAEVLQLEHPGPLAGHGGEGDGGHHHRHTLLPLPGELEGGAAVAQQGDGGLAGDGRRTQLQRCTMEPLQQDGVHYSARALLLRGVPEMWGGECGTA